MRLKSADLVPGTDYVVQVRSVRNGQYSEWSEKFNFTTDQNLTVPAAPATVTWVPVNDAFAATWTEVTTDISGGAALIDSYELELTAGVSVQIVTVQAQIGQGGAYTLTFSANVSLFGTPK